MIIEFLGVEINWKDDILNILYRLQTEILPINLELYHYYIDNFNIFLENSYNKLV